MLTSEFPKPHPVLYHLATHPHAYHPIPKAEARPEPSLQGEAFSSDVRAFCTLLARIMMRCLKEQNEQALRTLSLPSQQRSKE